MGTGTSTATALRSVTWWWGTSTAPSAPLASAGSAHRSDLVVGLSDLAGGWGAMPKATVEALMSAPAKTSA